MVSGDVVDDDSEERRQRSRSTACAGPEAIPNRLDLAVSTQGDRVALTAHGHVALAGVGTLRRVDLFQPPASRLRNAVFMPDGNNMLAMSDASPGLT